MDKNDMARQRMEGFFSRLGFPPGRVILEKRRGVNWRIINHRSSLSASAKNQAKTSARKTGTENEEPVMQHLTW
jgi:hypothetical protein